MKFTITIDSKIYEIEISPEHHEKIPSSVKLNGKDMPVRISSEWEKEFPKHFILNNMPYEVEFEYGEDGFPKRLWLDGAPCDVQINFLGKAKISKSKAKYFAEGRVNVIVSPMPGKIIRVCVREGQKLAAGELCIVLEAMKMENELEAQSPGIIKQLNVKEGDLVDIDQVLLVFEDRDEMFY
jgi:acetyl/propionyl-CoA carboxylase alpha subunit